MNQSTILLLIGIAVGLLATGLVNRKPQGRITSPRNGDRVSRLFRAEGTADSLLAGQHLFLVVEIGGLKWPKGEAQVNDTSWVSEIYEGGTPPQGKFTLALYLVGNEAYGEISAWLERGQATGHYPGLSRIKDGIRLHSVQLRLKS